MTSLPQFFKEDIPGEGNEVELDEDTGKHIVQVLRMDVGERLQLTDGKGRIATTTIIKTEKKNCSVVINGIVFHHPRQAALHLGIAFTKNTSRNEWLLEKATELGVRSIIPIVAARTVKEKIRYDRWRNILVSALLQSQQYYLPELHEAIALKDIIQLYSKVPQKLVAHCIEGYERSPISKMLNPGLETLVLIGPEGDFTVEEVTLCTEQQIVGISLGTQRLRTETAAMAVSAYFNMVNL